MTMPDNVSGRFIRIFLSYLHNFNNKYRKNCALAYTISLGSIGLTIQRAQGPCSCPWRHQSQCDLCLTQVTAQTCQSNIRAGLTGQ